MAKPSVDIVITADDQATAKFKQVEKSMTATSKTFKQGASQAKASTEVIGTLATVTAGSSSALSGFAGELAQITERLSAFSEVADKGGAGALAFKAGILAAAGALSFKLGNAIGEAIFQTEKLNREFARTVDEANRLNRALQESGKNRFSEQLDAIKELATIEERRAAALQAQAKVDEDIARRKQRIVQLEEEHASATSGIRNWTVGWFTDLEKVAATTESNLENEKAILETLREQSSALSMVGSEAERLAEAEEKRKQAADLKDASDNYLRGLQDQLDLLTAQDKIQEDISQRIRNGELSVDAEQEAVRLQRAISAEQERLELARQRADEEKRAADEAIRAAEQAAKAEADRLKKSSDYVQSLRDQLQLARSQDKSFTSIAQKLRDGELTQRDAIEALKLQRQLDAEQSSGSSSAASNLQATQGRLLTRGSGQDNIAKQTQHNTEKTAKGINELIQAVKEMARNQGQQVRLEVVR